MYKQTIKKFLSPIITRLLPGDFDQNRNDHAGALHKSWGHVFTNKMKGAYYEFGVYQGNSFCESYRIHQKYTKWVDTQRISNENWRRDLKYPTNHHFYGFDTFDGMPSNSENNPNFSEGTYISNLDEVIKL
jgi:hypothetical protein